MRTVRHLVAFSTALLVLALEGALPTLFPSGGSMAAWTLFPWMALSTAPRSRPAESPWRETLRTASFVLPPFGLGLGLDRARGLELQPLAWAAASTWVLLVLWTYSGERAVRSRRSGGSFALLWLVCLPASAALWVALAFAARAEGTPGAPLGFLAGANPLVWLHRWGRAGGLEGFEPSTAVAPFLLAVLVTLGIARSEPPATEGEALR